MVKDRTFYPILPGFVRIVNAFEFLSDGDAFFRLVAFVLLFGESVEEL